MSAPLGFPIGFVSTRTGLTAHVIRAWERRYQAVAPARTASGRRVYSQADLDRLLLLKQATDNGYRISHIADLATEKLAELVRGPAMADDRSPVAAKPLEARECVEACLKAVAALDAGAVIELLQQAAVSFSRQFFLHSVIQPFMEAIGRKWAEGSLRIVHGHLASTVAHAQLSGMLMHSAPAISGKPRLLAAAPAGQSCQMGAMAAAIVAQDHGWEPLFLGPDLPSEEIAAARSEADPQLIALSITCRGNDAFVHNEFARLSQLIGGACPVLVGGRASAYYRRCIESTGAHLCTNTTDLVRRLE
jgi:DNA-binding transcriptional MerR regulator